MTETNSPEAATTKEGEKNMNKNEQLALIAEIEEALILAPARRSRWLGILALIAIIALIIGPIFLFC